MTNYRENYKEMSLGRKFWGNSSLKTMVTGKVLFPDGKGGWNIRYCQYKYKIIYPSAIIQTIAHVSDLLKGKKRHYHYPCFSVICRCKNG